MTHRVLQPPGWPRPKGYANGVAARGLAVFVAGQIGWDAGERLVSSELVPQVRAALGNVLKVLAEAGARPEHLVRLTWYLTDRGAYLAAQREIGAVYRELIGPHYPAMSAVEVAALIEPGALVEIEATAVIPDAAG